MKSNILKRLIRYLKPYRFSLFFIFLFTIIGTIFTVMAPSIMGEITTVLYDGVSTGYFNWEKILFLILVLVFLYLIGQLFTFLQTFGMAKVNAKMVQHMRGEINQKMHRIKLNYYDTKTNGEILSVITNDVDVLNNTISQNLTQIITQTITAIGILIMMLRINVGLAILAIIMIPISIISALGVMKVSTKHFGKQQELLGKLNGYIEEMYNGQSIIQTYNYQEKANQEFEKLNDALQKSSQSAEIASGMISPITSLVNNAGYIVSAIIGCLLVLSGQMTVGNVQAMLQYTKQFSQPFISIAGMAGSFGAAIAGAKRIFDLLDAEEEIPDPEHGKVPVTSSGAVEFKNVSFGYTSDKLLMKDVTISVKPGQKVAIVGPTGAGKTTLINLLMRFYEINSGEILVDGVNTKEMTRKELRNRFGMVLQDTWLFEGTIAENLAYSKEELTEEEMIVAAQAASADSFIHTLPGGYNMILSKGAENISQGERQLLTIARAMASNPEIMILDEATSNVDTHTEQKIQKAMAKLMKGRTSFVIAHRLSTIKDADMILYMENGDIKEVGTHDTLMALHGKYETLYNSQFA